MLYSYVTTKKTPRYETIKDIYLPVQRNVAVVGGILSLEPQYRRILKENNFVPRIYNRNKSNLRVKVAGTDVIFLFIATVSHKMAQEIRKAANGFDIPLVTVSPSSVSALKRSIDELFVDGAGI